ncbi:DegT/DnrJ/EryC1/StrS family aminotransferase, partial [bacterium]|nr:DegT/DnrJ/EryC1/StrS family aminotransferase [bacterium]
MKVPLLDVNAQITSCKIELIEAMRKVIDECRFINGPEVKELEEKIALYTGSECAVGCASGTDALWLALRALDIKQGDEVITSPFTFFATAGAIYNVGATPVFADIDENTFNIDPAEIEKKISPKTKCVIPVHLFGQCAEMDIIMKIASKHNIAIIEDAAQSLGAKYKYKMAGTVGDFGCYSFFPSKNLGCLGDGGMVTANSTDLAEKALVLRNHGSKPKYYHRIVGTNSRLDTLQAAVLLVKINYLNDWAQKRREHAFVYNEAFNDLKNVTTPYIDRNCYHVFNQYTIKVSDRNKLQAYLTQKEIGSAIYYPLPLHLQKCFSYLGYSKGDFPVAEKVSKEVLSLPVYPELYPMQQEYVIDSIKEFY